MKLSLIVPVYNSSDILIELIDEINASMKKTKLINNFEILLINDFSQDNSWEVIKSLAFKYKFIKGINLAKNFGQHNAIIAGLNFCTGEKVITLDDDLQHPPEFIIKIYDKLNDFDVCYTYYKNRQHLKWKKVASSLNNIVSSFLLNKPFYIYMSSFRGIKRNIIENMIKFKESDVYLDSLILKSTKKIAMITVNHNNRLRGESTYTFKKLLILWSNMIINFSFYPLRIASFFGIALKLLVRLLRKKNNKTQYSILEKTF